jgi:hypothetical protein
MEQGGRHSGRSKGGVGDDQGRRGQTMLVMEAIEETRADGLNYFLGC